MDLRIQIDEPRSDSRRVVLQGRLDTHTFDELDHRLAPILSSNLRVLVLDLADLEYISSAGIRSIFKARKAFEGRGGKVLVTNLQPQIRKVFDIVKAVPMNSIFTSMAEADSYLDAMQKKVLQGEDDI